MKTAVDKNESELDKMKRESLEWLDRYGKTAPPFISVAVNAFFQSKSFQPSEVTDEILKLIPDTWLDPLLSGKDKIMGGYPFDEKDIERLLLSIKVRIKKHLDLKESGKIKPPIEGEKDKCQRLQDNSDGICPDCGKDHYEGRNV